MLTLVACGGGAGASGGAPMVVAVVEVTDAAPPPASATISGANAPPPGAGGREGCQLEATVGDITPSSKTCTIYEQVSRGGRVTLPCGGADGPASATFGEHEYKGEVHAKRLTLDHSYDFDEKDGCRWRVKGRISGFVGGGADEQPKLSWTYREQILEDETSHCWATCTAHTSIKLSPVQ